MMNIDKESFLFHTSQSCGLTASAGAKIKPFVELMQLFDPDPMHPIHVARLAVKLFDELRCLHFLGDEERFLLNAAALCHDIGWSQRKKKHNKGSRDLILRENLQTVSSRQQMVIALTARYHRGKIPKSKHLYYADLTARDQLLVNKQAALLRIADGLDRTHTSVVEDISVCEESQKVQIHLLTKSDSSQEQYAVIEKKKDLFELVFSKSLELKENRIH